MSHGRLRACGWKAQKLTVTMTAQCKPHCEQESCPRPVPPGCAWEKSSQSLLTHLWRPAFAQRSCVRQSPLLKYSCRQLENTVPTAHPDLWRVFSLLPILLSYNLPIFSITHTHTHTHTHPSPAPAPAPTPAPANAEVWKKRPMLIHQKSWLPSLQSKSNAVNPKTKIPVKSRDWPFDFVLC